MQYLKDLIKLVSPARLRISHLNTSKRSNLNQLSSLYLGIHTGEIKSDEDIQHAFFADHSKGLNYSRNLKNRLFQKLLNYIFLIDFDNKTPTHIKELYGCYKNYAAFQIMFGLGLSNISIPLAKRTLKKCVEFNLTELVVSISRKLQTYYGNSQGNQKEFLHYSELTLEYSERLHAEIQAEYYRHKIQFHFVNSRAAQTEVLPELAVYCSKAHILALEHQSFKLYFHYYKMEMMRHQILADHQQVVNISQRALDHFAEENWPLNNYEQFTFRMNAVPAHIHLRQYEEALSKIRQCFNYTKPNHTNHYIVLFYQVLFALRSKQFHLAIEALDLALPLNQIPSASLREQWRITEAYIAFFTDRPFRLGKLLNEVPIFVKDKRGNNINLIIIQILFFLRKGRYGAIIDRVDALELYAYRHLRKDETYRSNCFIKMLAVMVKQDFHLVATQRNAKPYLKRLEEMPLNLARQGAEMELIPYEELWEIVTEMLDVQRHIVRRRG